MSEAIKNRYEFVYLFDVENGNPNGDPDAGNMPRIDLETSIGLVTDVCIKRKIRNYVDITRENNPPFEIHVREGNFLSENHKRAHLAIENESISIRIPSDLKKEFETFDKYPDGISYSITDDGVPVLVLELGRIEDAEKKSKKIKMSDAALSIIKSLFVDSKDKRAKQWMCKNFFDVRTFGAVMSTGDMTCGQVRGPVQISFAKSIDPISPVDVPLSRTAAVRVAKPSDKGLGARKSIVHYGLYRAEGYISAHFAKHTGFSEQDLDLLWESLANMFDHDHSAARGKMNARKLFVFKHDTALGNAPAHKLFDLISVARNGQADTPARQFADYTIECNKKAVPNGVTLTEKL